MRQRLERWKGKCVVCYHAERECNHIISQCPAADSKAAEQERRVASSKRGIVFEKGVVCYQCGVPRSICERWVSDSVVASGQSCQFYGVLIGVVYGIKHAYLDVWRGWFERAS